MHDTSQLLKLADIYYQKCCVIKTATIKKLPSGKYRVLSMKGKNLGTYKTRAEAVERLKMVEYFKHKDKIDENDIEDKSIIDLTAAIDFSYSAIMREMRQKASKEQVREFLIAFKKEFDAAVKNKLQKPEKIALQNSLIKFNKKHKIKTNKKLVKNAAISELGDPVQVGKYLANIVRFTINRMPQEKRTKALESLKHKFYAFNANEIAQKEMPATSAIGQSVAFVKNVLFGHDAHYVRDVINNIVGNL